jgi:electron transfer flavoprotein alpha/beta subunit
VAAEPAASPDQRITRVYAPEKSKHTEMIGGSAAEAAHTLVERLRDEARVLR